MSEKVNIDHLAQLSRLKLSKVDSQRYAEQIGEVLKYVEKLTKKGGGGDIKVGVVNDLQSVYREDKVEKGLNRKEALKNAPAQKSGFFQVRSVFKKN